MAENKIVNTTQLEADLTSIANAIREKAETSDSLVFPSGFLNAISNLEVGSGLPNGISALASGTFTISSNNVSTYTFEHGLGVKPNFYFVVAAKEFQYTEWNNAIYRIFGEDLGGNICFKALWYSNSSTDALVSRNVRGGYIATNDSTITTENFGTSYTFRNGMTYVWVCGVIDGVQ